jgi:DHA2 family multidrug resistance protein
MILLPQFYQGLMNYTASDAGLALSTRVFACAVLFGIGKICHLYDVRWVIIVGFLFTGVSISMCVNLNMQVSPDWITTSNILFGIGMATAMVPISGIALGTLKKEEIPSGAGVHSLSKCVTASIATSLASSLTICLGQVHQTYLVKNMSIYSYNFVHHFNAIKSSLLHTNESFIATNKANLSLYNQLLAQSKLCAISDIFIMCATLTFLMIPLVMLLRIEKNEK